MTEVVIVPAEPTPEMVEAGWRAAGDSHEGRPVWKCTVDVQATLIYRAMLAARPAAPTQSAAQTGEVLGPDQHGRVPYAVTAMMEKPGKMGWRTSLVWARSEDEASGMWARIASEQNPDWTVVQPGALAITPEKLAAISQLEPSE